jgi:hypothetical protein
MTTAAASIAARVARRLDARKRREDIAAAAWEWMQIRASDMNVDRLLCRPTLAAQMCRSVRRSFKDASESEICEALLAERKLGKFQTEKRSTNRTNRTKD